MDSFLLVYRQVLDLFVLSLDPAVLQMGQSWCNPHQKAGEGSMRAWERRCPENLGAMKMGGEKEISLSNLIAWKAVGGLERTHMALECTMALTTQTFVCQHVLFQRSSTASPPCVLPAPENAPDRDLAWARLSVCRPSPNPSPPLARVAQGWVTQPFPISWFEEESPW